jgi:hypothetical protein
MTPPPGCCAWCGEVFEVRSDGGRAQRFCSIVCRRALDAAGSAQERPKELQRFGEEVHAIAAETGIAIYPNKSRAVAVASSARHPRKRCASHSQSGARHHSASVKSQ